MSQDRNNKSLTEKITDNNVSSVREQIHLKQGSKPFFGTSTDTKTVMTDMDHFPYTRFFRGVYYSSDPIAIEREAGWRPTKYSCYRPTAFSRSMSYPNHCFESACSTVYPCYPPYLQKFSDKDSLNVQLNRSCIVQYR